MAASNPSLRGTVRLERLRGEVTVIGTEEEHIAEHQTNTQNFPNRTQEEGGMRGGPPKSAVFTALTVNSVNNMGEQRSMERFLTTGETK
uniref:Uncharacterized protein n=1 Tax=Anguilla anguilla TaxID=7936 RepID=A0A0E9T595_ANGAN